MDLSSFEVKNASVEDLKAIVSMCEQELKIRNAARRDELIQKVCDAMNLLHKEFPAVELRVEYECPSCTIADDIDMMDYFCGAKKMSPKDFYI